MAQGSVNISGFRHIGGNSEGAEAELIVLGPVKLTQCVTRG